MSNTSLSSVVPVVLLCVTTLLTCSDEEDKPQPPVSFSGIAWSFSLPGEPYGRIAGATVSILELSELTATTNDQGEFTIDGLPVGSQATLVLEHDDHPLTYTKTFTVPETNLTDVTFQIPATAVYSAIEDFLDIESDPDRCQIVSTFTRFGKSIGDQGHHGEPGAIVTVEPEMSAEEGPIYFSDAVLPDRSRSYSSLDGGVLFLNVEPGDYTLTASCVDGELLDAFIDEYPPDEVEGESLRCQTEDLQFEPILVKCRAGVFLNASPSYGLQALE